MHRPAAVLAVLSVAFSPTVSSGEAAPAPDPWGAVLVLQGEWLGAAEGEPGSGTARRSYQFTLAGRFLQERNVSAYVPKKAGEAGELHEHVSFWSYDRARKLLVLRQFHQEGFVNQYRLVSEASSAQRLVFESEAFENLPVGWRAKETYAFQGSDAFTETFELAAPGQEYAVYSKSRFQRIGRP
jgi:hypothetical protein